MSLCLNGNYTCSPYHIELVWVMNMKSLHKFSSFFEFTWHPNIKNRYVPYSVAVSFLHTLNHLLTQLPILSI